MKRLVHENVRSPSIVWSAVLFVFALLLPQILPTYYVNLSVLALSYAVMAMGTNLLLGYVGLPSLGQALYFGIAGYAVAILSINYGYSAGTASLLAVCIAVLVAAVTGLLLSHLREDYFLLATLALGMVAWGLAYRWVSLTGGDNGLPGVFHPRWFRGIQDIYYFALAVLMVVIFVFRTLVRSRLGLSLQGARENDERLTSLGYNVWLLRYVSIIVSASFAAMGGVIYIFYSGFISPEDVHLSVSFESLLMVILGGPGAIAGPLVGASIISLLKNVLSVYTDRWMALIGIVYIVSMFVMRQGIMGGYTRWPGGTGGGLPGRQRKAGG